ncbi:unnamed protein product, partial [Brenthis ino]
MFSWCSVQRRRTPIDNVYVRSGTHRSPPAAAALHATVHRAGGRAGSGCRALRLALLRRIFVFAELAVIRTVSRRGRSPRALRRAVGRAAGAGVRAGGLLPWHRLGDAARAVSALVLGTGVQRAPHCRRRVSPSPSAPSPAHACTLSLLAHFDPTIHSACEKPKVPTI